VELALLVSAILLLVLTLFSIWVLFSQLLRQHGRLLLRLEAVEQALTSVDGAASASAGAHRDGLAVGAPVPSFRLPDLTGKTVGLEDFRGTRVLLVHWSTGCGFCDQIAHELAELQKKLSKCNVEIVLASYGDADSNRRHADKHGLDCPILLQPQGEPIEAFRMLGTPVAYLLDEEGRVAEQLAIGATEVPELARSAAEGRKRLANERPVRESKLERGGLKAGTPAPAFELPDLDGHPTRLEAYRGRRVLLVFSDPNCGPCDALAPELADLGRVHGDDGVAIVMVSRGDVDENRRKADDHGIDFPVLVQPGWQVSKQYCIFETPVAFLIDEDGVIAEEVARGSTEILALVHEALAARREALVT
jgi:peroxiredoxin